MLDHFSSETINYLESMHYPNHYWTHNTREYKYWFRSLLQKIDSSIVFKNLPDKWSNDFFMFSLWTFGYVAVFSSNRKDLEKYGDGLLFSPATLSGMDFYRQPIKASINNEYYQKTLTIGKDTEILKLCPDFNGCIDIIDHYAVELAEYTKSIFMGLQAAKVPLILSAKNEAQSETLKKVWDKIQSGQMLVITGDLTDNDEIIPTKDPFESWTQDYKQSYILHDLLADMKTTLDDFYNEIGIPVAIEKKERLVASESEFSIAQSQARVSTWVNTITESLKRINDHFGTNIEVEYASTNDIDRNGTGIEQE